MGDLQMWKIAFLLVTATACSTIPEPLSPPDITEEPLHLHLADHCNIVMEPGGKYLKCEGESMFAVGDDCVVKMEKNNRYLECSE